MTVSSRHRFAILAASAATLIALAGCSGGGSAAGGGAPAGQSKTAACKALESSVSAASTDLNASLGNIASDPTAAVGKLQSVADAFDTGLKKVTNADVKKAGAKADDSLKAMITQVKGALADPANADSTKLQASVTAVSDDFTAIGKVCK
ncbi:hypothetical protein [Glaciihabitans sp. UYNi722]|uniref:hypothetical protein n=1 Tax=Glaciihabitans sp. UYNi722 TaxID=3156344 RepID=UPI00339AA311